MIQKTYLLRAHKSLRNDLEATAKVLDIPYGIDEEGEEIVISIPAEKEHNLIHGFFSGVWRTQNDNSL